MARPRKPARTLRWKGDWYLFWFDHNVGKKRRTKCSELDAHNAKQRRELVTDYRSREVNDAGEVQRRGGRLAYDTQVLDALDRFNSYVDRRVGVRKVNSRGREGLSEVSGQVYKDSVSRFTVWLKNKGKSGLTTGDLDAEILTQFFDHLAAEKTVRGKLEIRRAGATLNRHRRHLKACLNHLNGLRPPLFPDFAALIRGLKPVPTENELPASFGPKVLEALLAAALEYEDPDRVAVIERRKPGGSIERFEQAAPSASATPASRLILLLALTGGRLGEALALRWTDVDLRRGRITIHAQKTGRTRILPLVGAPEGEIAPRFLELLRLWHMQSGGAEYVLPHEGLDAPHFPKSAWQAINKLAKVERIGPQKLRQSFCAYASSMGVPASVAALWQGHASAVAEKWYRSQVLDRANGDTFEDAMGLTALINQMMQESEVVDKIRPAATA